jgi:hypothetical protein
MTCTTEGLGVQKYSEFEDNLKEENNIHQCAAKTSFPFPNGHDIFLEKDVQWLIFGRA